VQPPASTSAGKPLRDGIATSDRALTPNLEATLRAIRFYPDHPISAAHLVRGLRFGVLFRDSPVEFRTDRTTTGGKDATPERQHREPYRRSHDRNAMVDRCFTYDDALRKDGHFAGGEALQPSNTAKTLRSRSGKVIVTDGPYAETKEQIGGILILEARDIDHAVELMSKHPGVSVGPFEIRPAADLTGMIRESEQRRAPRKV
jgi:hypothetical protein